MKESRFKLLFVVAASLVFSTGAMIAQPVANDPPVTHEPAVMPDAPHFPGHFIDDPDCPDLTPPTFNGPNQAYCYDLWRVRYLLGEITCAEYTTGVEECEGIPN